VETNSCLPSHPTGDWWQQRWLKPTIVKDGLAAAVEAQTIFSPAGDREGK